MTETTLRDLIEESLWENLWAKGVFYIDNITTFEEEEIQSAHSGLVVVMKDRKMYHIIVKEVKS